MLILFYLFIIYIAGADTACARLSGLCQQFCYRFVQKCIGGGSLSTAKANSGQRFRQYGYREIRISTATAVFCQQRILGRRQSAF